LDIFVKLNYCGDMMPATQLTIREFRPGDEAAFRRLNEEWITRFFAMESKDVASLADPWGTVLNPGGRIFLAVQDAEAVGCCALLAMGEGEFEVAKMAVTEAAQGAGIGRRLLETAMAAARTQGARRLYLETNGKLTPAIRLYESLGFRHIPAERVTPSPYARSNVSMELYLEP
jgi:putative acetyltransferase